MVIIYPDTVLDWISARTGREFDWRYFVWLEVVAIGLMIVAMTLLMPVCPKLDWWYPLLFIGAAALARGIRWLVLEILGYHDL